MGAFLPLLALREALGRRASRVRKPNKIERPGAEGTSSSPPQARAPEADTPGTLGAEPRPAPAAPREEEKFQERRLGPCRGSR